MSSTKFDHEGGARAGSAPAASRRGPTSEVVFVGRGALAPLVRERLANALGDRGAAEVFAEIHERFGDRDLETPQDLLDFAELLVKSGGMIQAVGRSLKVQALLRGAVEP